MRRALFLALAFGLLVPTFAPVAAASCACDPSPLILILTAIVLPCVAGEVNEARGSGDGCVYLEGIDDGVECIRDELTGAGCPP